MLRTEFLDAMSRVVSSVSIVTTDGAAGRRGATVSAMTSVSADGESPTLLVCLHHEASAASAIRDNGVFCVNLLADDQSEIANIFASRTAPAGGDKFSCARFHSLTTGAPVLEDALASFDCTLKSHEQVGTHLVMIGAVQNVLSREGRPLLYGNRAYQQLQ